MLRNALRSSRRVAKSGLWRGSLAPATHKWRLPAVQAFQSGIHVRYASTDNTTQVDSAQLLCYFASIGDVDGVKKLLEAGIDANKGDYDKRTALHLAASEGQLECVKILIAHGARVDVVDRWGGSPLTDSIRGKHADVTTYLQENGAMFSHEDAATSMCVAAAQGDVEQLKNLISSGYTVSNGDTDNRTPLHLAASEGHLEVMELLISSGADVNAVDRFGNTPLLDAQRGGHSAAVNVLKANGGRQQPKRQTQIKQITTDADQQEHLAATYEILNNEAVFNANVINQEVDWFYNKLRLQAYYFRRFSPTDTADHIQSYVAAKRLATASNRRQDIHLAMERTDGGFFLCPDDPVEMAKLEESMERLMERSEESSWSLTHFLSGGVAVPYGSKKLSMYILDKSAPPPKTSDTETRLEKIATPSFLKSRPDAVKDRYTDILSDAVHRNSPVFQVYPQYRDGTTPVMIAFRNTSIHSPLSSITRLMTASSITCERKMVETFSNGMTVYSLYIHQKNTEQLQEFIDQVGLLFTAPASSALTPLFLNGGISAKEYAYCSMVKKFAFYFLSQETEEFKLLHEALGDDRINANRLTTLRQKMKRDSVSESRIAECIANYPHIVKECFAEFDAAFNPDGPRKKVVEPNEKLLHQINKAAFEDLDRSILTEFLHFNHRVLKTNFYKSKKSALACRIDPSFLEEDMSGQRAPFGVFMMMSRDFHGFHVRFQDVARGGLRLIKSANTAAYARNAESLFVENYNLALTQNFKNKDIPEFGSKGTILLARDCQNNQSYAFRKYISSLVDLLIANEQVVDHYGSPEIIFCGPDENTADLMDWAALYAKRRGYPFWKAFTTGKPPALGGIPHDTYGMTTRSVHTFVVETLRKKGWSEEEITKLQTGGPDGDLGCNEIRISKDRTTSIVDGSGVLHDPEGINRSELMKLAEARKMVQHFPLGKLSPKGFYVHVDGRDVQLPNGEVVESGLAFRNEFHLNPLSSADLFVPCGGRPEAVNAKNVHQLFDADGITPRFKAIVEGANLFFTQEARGVLENAGVILFKDASTNKGGVTSSSLEVLAALTMTDGEFAEHMMVPSDGTVPPFYKQYVDEVQEKIEENARLEFECLWREHEATHKPRHLLTDEVSDKINTLNSSIASSGLFNNKKLRDRVLGAAIPEVLVRTVGDLDTVVERLPEPYCKAIFSAYLASRYVYRCGMTANEFRFYEFMKEFEG